MMGDQSSEEKKGIIPRSFGQIIGITETSSDKKFLVRVSYIQIYNEEVHDLLSKDVRQHKQVKQLPGEGFYVKDVNLVTVRSVKEMQAQMKQGFKARAVGQTLMNKESSRSHSIFTILIQTQSGETFTCGKLNFVDLAGSEKQSKTKAEGDRFKEAVKINLSLSTLGNVISSLVDGKSHIPYRVSKLTKLLQDSLGGNTKTIMFANVSPADYNTEETLSTLHYASRAKFIQNKPKVNEDPKDALLKEYANEIQRLKEMLTQNGGAQPGMVGAADEDEEEEEDSSQMMKFSFKDKLRQKQNLLFEEKRQKQSIASKLKSLTQQLVVSEQNPEKKKKYDELQQKVKRQEQIQNKLIAENQKREEKLLTVNSNYQNLKEENQQLRQLVTQLRAKLEGTKQQAREIEKQANEQKMELLESISQSEKEFAFLKAVSTMMLRADHIEEFKNRCTWDEDMKEVTFPNFTLKEKKQALPRLEVETVDYNPHFRFGQADTRSDSTLLGKHDLRHEPDRRLELGKHDLRHEQEKGLTPMMQQERVRKYLKDPRIFERNDMRTLEQYNPEPPRKSSRMTRHIPNSAERVPGHRGGQAADQETDYSVAAEEQMKNPCFTAQTTSLSPRFASTTTSPSPASPTPPPAGPSPAASSPSPHSVAEPAPVCPASAPFAGFCSLSAGSRSTTLPRAGCRLQSVPRTQEGPTWWWCRQYLFGQTVPCFLQAIKPPCFCRTILWVPMDFQARCLGAGQPEACWRIGTRLLQVCRARAGPWAGARSEGRRIAGEAWTR